MGVQMRHEVVVIDPTDGVQLVVRERDAHSDEGPDYEIVARSSQGSISERLYVSLVDLENLRLNLGNFLDDEGFQAPPSADDPWVDRTGEGPRDAGTDATTHRHPF